MASPLVAGEDLEEQKTKHEQVGDARQTKETPEWKSAPWPRPRETEHIKGTTSLGTRRKPEERRKEATKEGLIQATKANTEDSWLARGNRETSSPAPMAMRVP
jgi:hypothetical protein